MLKKLIKDLQEMDYEVDVDYEKMQIRVYQFDDYGTEIEHTFRFNELNAHLGLATTSVLSYVLKKMDARRDLLTNYSY